MTWWHRNKQRFGWFLELTAVMIAAALVEMQRLNVSPDPAHESLDFSTNLALAGVALCLTSLARKWTKAGGDNKVAGLLVFSLLVVAAVLFSHQFFAVTLRRWFAMSPEQWHPILWLNIAAVIALALVVSGVRKNDEV